jgi:ABC transporter substrate binding protein
LVRSNPDVIFAAGGDSATRTLKAGTQTVPIVGGAEDMVASGLVTSLSRPGGNITGFSMLSPQLDGRGWIRENGRDKPGHEDLNHVVKFATAQAAFPHPRFGRIAVCAVRG